jgi:hypothetical protein
VLPVEPTLVLHTPVAESAPSTPTLAIENTTPPTATPHGDGSSLPGVGLPTVGLSVAPLLSDPPMVQTAADATVHPFEPTNVPPSSEEATATLGMSHRTDSLPDPVTHEHPEWERRRREAHHSRRPPEPDEPVVYFWAPWRSQVKPWKYVDWVRKGDYWVLQSKKVCFTPFLENV